MDSPRPFPAGAQPFYVTVDPDLDALRIYENWDVWQQGVISEMQAEGITITHLDGLNTFYGTARCLRNCCKDISLSNRSKQRKILPH